MTAQDLLAQVEGLRRSEPARALAVLEAGFGAVSRRADAGTRGTLWRTRGHVLRSLRRTREAARAYEHAARAFRRAGDVREEGRCAIGLVDALMYLGRDDAARRAARRGRRLLVRARDRAALARLQNNEGNLWHRLDLPERALTCYREAVRGLERAGDARSARMIGVNVGNCLSLLGRLDEARRHYRGAQRAQAAAGAINEALSAEYNLAYLDFLDHRAEAALVGLDRVREQADARDYPSLSALARLDRAEILLRLGAHDAALDEARAAHTACQALGLAYEAAKAELFAALACFRQGRPAEARRGIERALAGFAGLENQVWTGEALLGLATLWREAGNAPATSALLAAARRRFAAAGDREREACAGMLETRARIDAGQPAAARARLARALARAPRGASARLEHLRLAARAALAQASGDAPSARRWLTRAAEQAERLAARILDEEWRATFWGDWGWPHLELAALELAQGRTAQALEALEAGRGRATLGRGTTRGAHALPPGVRRWTAARQAREREPRRGGVVVASGALRQVLSRRAPRRVRAGALQRALPPGALLLDQWLHDGGLGTMAVQRGALRGDADLAREPHLTRLVHDVLFALRSAAFRPREQRAHDPALAQSLAELAALTLWPWLEAARPRALALAPTGALARLPWAAMPLPDGRALIEAMPLVLVPGLRSVMAPRTRRASGPGLVVAVDTGDLAAIEAETAAVRAAFPDAQVIVGDAATAERFIALAPRADWIHFAGHGAFRADDPRASGLRLADRWLLTDELANLGLGARWVTLSACHTARALVRPGEEWFGLSRALLLAGAESVVAAQWDVEDSPTASLMADTYARLAAGRPASAALAGAQAQRAAARIHPVDWAGFVVLGGPRALPDAPAGTPGTSSDPHFARA